jgi:hypothetical protein
VDFVAMNPTEPGAVPLPINFRSSQPSERDRLTAALRLIWVIPQAFVYFFVAIAAFFVVIAGWFGALVTGELPEFAEEFLSGVLRWGTRLQGYLYFLTDEYPPFSLGEFPDYPIQISIPPLAPLNRLAVLFRLILVIPAAIVSSVLAAGLGLVSVGSWAMITFTGAQPIPLYEASRVVTRFQTRVGGYFTMLTAEYPWGVLGDQPEAGGEGAAASDGWAIRLSQGGRNAMIVVIVLGAIYEVLYRR